MKYSQICQIFKSTFNICVHICSTVPNTMELFHLSQKTNFRLNLSTSSVFNCSDDEACITQAHLYVYHRFLLSTCRSQNKVKFCYPVTIWGVRRWRMCSGFIHFNGYILFLRRRSRERVSPYTLFGCNDLTSVYKWFKHIYTFHCSVIASMFMDVYESPL